MSTTDFDVSSKFQSYTDWNDKRGQGYENLKGLNNLENANIAIATEVNLLLGTTIDPTNGAKQWRGTKSAQDLIIKYSESGVEVPIKTLGVEYKGYYITNVTTIITNTGYHTFFDFTRTKPTSVKKP